LFVKKKFSIPVKLQKNKKKKKKKKKLPEKRLKIKNVCESKDFLISAFSIL